LSAEQLVKESEQRFRVLSENTNDIIILHDPEGYFKYVSPKVKELLGYAPEDLLGKHFLDFDFGRENEALVYEVLQQVKEGKECPLVNLWYRSKDRTYKVALQSSFSQVLDDQGSLIGFVSSSRDITAESHSKKALEDSERKFRLISENVTDIIALHNNDLTFYWASPSFYQKMEVSPEDIEGKRPNQIWPTRNQRILNEEPSRGIRTLEVEHQVKSGKWIWLEVTIAPFIDENIGFHGSIALSRDISERKAYEERLQRQRNSFETILEGSLSGYWYFYPQENKQYISPKFKKLLGYSEDEIGEDPQIWNQIMPKKDHQRLLKKIEVHSRTSSIIPLFEEVKYKHKSGKLIHIICAGKVLQRDKDGTATEMAGTYIDLTYVREVENKLIRTESALQIILEKTRLVIWIRDVETNEIIYLSDSAKVFFDVSKTTLKLGEKFYYKNLHPEDEDRVQKVFQTQEYLRDGKVDLKYRIKIKSGEYIWLRTRGFTIIDQQGKYFRVGISEDVSQQQLWETELESTLKKERDLNAMKSYFISMVSHQFRTPMAIMQTNTELVDMVLERSAPEAKVKVEKYTKRIHGEVTRLTSLLSDILILEKSRLGKINLNLTEIRVADMVQEIVDDFNAQSRMEGECVVQKGLEELTLKVDESYLRHALVNIIGNAYKYTPENRPAPRISISKTAKEMMILVEDSGIGIEDKEISALFNPFFRGSNTGSFQGTGLGLVIAKEFIEEMDGEILVSSQSGKGSAFAVMLPLGKKRK
jgi:PAS domain S-box-containing protein